MFARVTRMLFVAWFAALAAALHRGATQGWTVGVGLVLFLLLFAHPTVLAVEFLLSRRIGVRVDGSRVAFPVVLRAWLREWVDSTLTFGWRLPWRARAVPDHLPASARGRRGVVLVHGFICNRALWNPWLERLRALDRAFVAVDLEPVFGDIDGYAAIVEAAVVRVEAATGLAPLVVAHSMGGLVVRAWLRAGVGRHARVAHVLTIGTPHRGAWIAGMALSPNARQMRIGSPWMAGLPDAAADAALFTCWWSECDQIVFPAPTAVLPGAESRRLPGVAHVSLTRREEIWHDLVARLAA
jgi:triacylglycerol esterase/lipase EstA (alpha/beta hydrolase family)